jgi:hypothetical protein
LALPYRLGGEGGAGEPRMENSGRGHDLNAAWNWRVHRNARIGRGLCEPDRL